MSRGTPFGNLANLLSLGVKLRYPLPVSATQDHSEVGPRMIMYIVGVAAQEVMQENVEWKVVAIFEH